MRTFEQILADLQLAAQVTASTGIPDVSQGAAIAASLLKIAQTAVKAHQDIIGEPLDLNLLQPID
jgi:hypothetical protein